MYCTVLYCTVLYCTVLYCTVLYCTVLYCIVLHCTVLHCTVLYCTVLHCTVLYCTVLYCTELYCTNPIHAAPAIACKPMCQVSQATWQRITNGSINAWRQVVGAMAHFLQQISHKVNGVRSVWVRDPEICDRRGNLGTLDLYYLRDIRSCRIQGWPVSPCSIRTGYFHKQLLYLTVTGVAGASETSVHVHQTTRRHFLQDSHHHSHRHENDKSYYVYSSLNRMNRFCLKYPMVRHAGEYNIT